MINAIPTISPELSIPQFLEQFNILNFLPVAVYVCDAAGVITHYNEKAVELWGRAPQPGETGETFYRSFRFYYADGSAMPYHETPAAGCLTDGLHRKDAEIIIEKPDLSRIMLRVNIAFIKDEGGNTVGVVNCFDDITENEKKFRDLAASLEKKIEERTLDLNNKNDKLRESEERYHKMIDEVEDYAIILLDKNGIIQNWNKGAEKIKGYKENEIVGKSFELFYLANDRESGLPKRLLAQATEKGKATHEGWRARKDGSYFWGSIVLTALHSDQNEIIGFSKVTRDLTERKMTEDKLKEYTAELEFQNKELEQFAYAASHDLKEPLRKIHFYNSFINEHASNLLDEKSKEYLNRSLNAVKRMNTLIEDLLTYSKTTSSTDSFDDVDMNEVIEEITFLHKDKFERKAKMQIVEKLPVICGVPFQIKQLFENLISNAIKYKHPDRNVVITIQSEILPGHKMKEKEAEPNKQYHKISVIDNGIGFEPQYSKKIFEIFQRLNNITPVKGAGIGLAICKKIAQNHKGFITAEGQVNEGARFDVYIPLK